jgi:pilus assembly protein CpaE
VTRHLSRVEVDPWEALISGEELPEAFANLAQSDVNEAGDLTVVVGAAGGVGTTTTACGLALATAAAGRAVALVELDLERGDLAGCWGVPPDRTLDDLTVVIEELRPNHVEMVCHRHPSGVWLLLAPQRPGAHVWWDAAATGLLLRSARLLGEVVVDAGPSLGAHVEEACRQATRIIVVTPPTIAGIRRLRALTTVLDTWDVRASRCVVSNRGVGRDHLGTRQVSRIADVAIECELPASPHEADDLQAGQWRVRRGRQTGLVAALDGLIS